MTVRQARAVLFATSAAVVTARCYGLIRLASVSRRHLSVTPSDELEAERLAAEEQRDHRLAAATHDMLNALAGLAGYLELLEDQPASEQSVLLQGKARQVATRLTMLGEDLLVHATAGTQLKVTPVKVSVAEELEACVSAFPGLDIRVDVEGGLVAVADRLRLHQVMGNLLRNAQRYGRPPVQVTARVRPQPGDASAGWQGAAGRRQPHQLVEIAVSDSGDGVPAGFVPDLFQPGTRALGTGVTGTGLGLAVARELAERQGGALHYDTAGRRFVLHLPGRSLLVADQTTNATGRGSAADPETAEVEDSGRDATLPAGGCG